MWAPIFIAMKDAMAIIVKNKLFVEDLEGKGAIARHVSCEVERVPLILPTIKISHGLLHFLIFYQDGIREIAIMRA